MTLLPARNSQPSGELPAPHPYYDVRLNLDEGEADGRGFFRRIADRNRAPRQPRYTLNEAARLKLSWWKSPAHWFYALALAFIVALFIWQASVYYIAVIDDAYITFRYSENLAHGEGLRFNPGGERVEGYSNFLWMVALAGAIRVGEITGLGCDLMLISKLMGMACAIAVILISFAFSRELRGRDDPFNLFAPLFIALNPHFAHWALMGLETIMAVMFIFYAYYRFLKEMNDQRAWLLSALAAALAAMTRIDSLYYLSPLGVFGFLLIFQGKIPIRRLFAWGVIAAAVFGSYFWSKILYFEDPAPNTYYAKQRYVSQTQRDRGIAHIKYYYTNPGGVTPKGYSHPAPKNPFNRAPGEALDKGAAIDYVIWLVGDGGRLIHAIWWMNWWLAAGVILLLFPAWRTTILILAPIALNVYFLYHVDGDWMPNFRFMQVVTPFWALAGAAAINVAQDMTKKWRASARLGVVAPIALFFTAALIGTCAEGLRIGYVFVWGKDPLPAPRTPDWVSYRSWSDFCDSLRKNYFQGFEPPLGDVSNWMLMNTHKGGITMSDIGQPMWFCRHLDLYDYDGLPDKHFGHAPSVLGKLKRLDQHYADVLAERNLPPQSKGDKFARKLQKLWATATGAAPQEDPYQAARNIAIKRHFDAQAKRNVDWIYNEIKPEYQLFFFTPAATKGAKVWPYPEEAAMLYNDPRMEQNYEPIPTQIAKVGSVMNNFFRRKDIPLEVPDAIKLNRLKRTIAKNPRLYYLIPFAYEQAHKMTDPKVKGEALAYVDQQIPRLKNNPKYLRELTYAAQRANDPVMRERLSEMTTGQSAPNDPTLWRAKADVAWADGKREEALKYLQKAAALSSPGDNAHYYHLVYYHETMGRTDLAEQSSRTAIKRNPKDIRAWTDLGAVAERASWDGSKGPEAQLARKRVALEGFEAVQRLQGDATPENIVSTISRLKTEAAALEAKIAEPKPEGAPPMPQSDAPPTTATEAAPAMPADARPTTPTATDEPKPAEQP